MRIIVIGGKGKIGSEVVKMLKNRHDVLTAARHGCDLKCDITSEDSIREMYENAGDFDALVATVGTVHFGDFSTMDAQKYRIGLNDKLMGQVNLVLVGRDYIREGGSFTLTSGVLSWDPIRQGSSASMVNSAIDGFVKAAAIEMPKKLRINSVSPTVIAEAMDTYAPFFRGFSPVPLEKAALGYVKSVEGLQTGQVYHIL